ncbi:MAG: hypothetical protein F6K40_02190 [Okeania sp. SIO3I5]|uniref:hypothetical protein n=1 Tax=Okeania sp. SIO3I5 TaxID=2607805 RepID=UPI0013B9361B|nr:hypothetical protein [Okeania sp. SIO3I5]NEQ35182.1 hypothetical protein [Okeania sp. SIO3I5]
MKAYIKLEGDVTGEDSFYFKELTNLIERECDLSVKIEGIESQPGVKGSLAIVLNIASLTLTTIQTLFTTLQYWESKQRNGELELKYSVFVVVYTRTFKERLLLKNLSAEKVIELQEIIRQHQLQPSLEDEYIEVQILKQR